MKCRIYIVKENKKAMFDQYPSLKDMLSSLNDISPFYNQQIDLLLESTKQLNTYFYTNFYQRSDYKKIGNEHLLQNRITNEITKCTVNEYCIDIESVQKSNSFIELICHKTQNYVIIL